MKIHLIKPFVLWILKKIGACIAETNRNYRKMLRNETGLAVFIFVLLCTVSTVVSAFIGMMASNGNSAVAGYTALAVFTVMITYFLYNAFSLMFAAFAKERQELFNYLKD